MKSYENIQKALEEHNVEVQVIIDEGCDYGVLLDYIASDNVKKKDLREYLLNYYTEWLNHAKEEGMIDEVEFTDKIGTFIDKVLFN